LAAGGIFSAGFAVITLLASAALSGAVTFSSGIDVSAE
jgi:hypothetical protein